MPAAVPVRTITLRRKSSYTTGDVARFLGCSTSSVSRAMDAGVLPSYRLGLRARRMISHAQLEAYLDSQPLTLSYRLALATGSPV